MIYPFPEKLQQTAGDFENGNFGLWFYKLVPLDDQKDFKAATPTAVDKNVAAFYHRTYDELKKNADLQKLLDKKHAEQQCFCRMHRANGASVIEIRAELKSPLITGIGQTHPNEIGMTFDHNMGIPYLPATGIKGLVRLAHILNLMADDEKAGLLIQGDELDDSHPSSLIAEIFGGNLKIEKYNKLFRGKVLFLDAYPEKIPDLHVDIMNPHYGAYYADDNGSTPPADYLDPNPVQFLTVRPGAVFLFRAVVLGNSQLQEPVMQAFHIALVEEGLGAKNAVGYGRFKIFNSGSPEKSDNLCASDEINLINPLLELSKSQVETWENAILTWIPGKGEVSATAKNKKATVIGKSVVPQVLHKKLFGKKKRVEASYVVVETVGNAYKILEIKA